MGACGPAAAVHRPVAMRPSAARDAGASPCAPFPVSGTVTPPIRGGGSKLAKAGGPGARAAGGGAAAASRLSSGARAAAAAVVAADFDPRRAAATGLLMVAEAAAAARDRGAAGGAAANAPHAAEARRAHTNGALALLSLVAEEAPRAPATTSTEHWRLAEAPTNGGASAPAQGTAAAATTLPALTTLEGGHMGGAGAKAASALSPKRAPSVPPAPIAASAPLAPASSAARPSVPVATVSGAAGGASPADAAGGVAVESEEAAPTAAAARPGAVTPAVGSEARAGVGASAAGDASAPPTLSVLPAKPAASSLLFVRLGGLRPPRISFGFDRTAGAAPASKPPLGTSNRLLLAQPQPTGASSCLFSRPFGGGAIPPHRPSVPWLRTVVRSDSLGSTASSGLSSPTDHLFSPSPSSLGDAISSASTSRSASAASTASAATTGTVAAGGVAHTRVAGAAAGGGGGIAPLAHAEAAPGPARRQDDDDEEEDDDDEEDDLLVGGAVAAEFGRGEVSDDDDDDDEDDDDDDEEDDLEGILGDAPAVEDARGPSSKGADTVRGLDGAALPARPPSRARRASDRSPARLVPKRHRNIEGRATPSSEDAEAEGLSAPVHVPVQAPAALALRR
jgi:hypothetical protein